MIPRLCPYSMQLSTEDPALVARSGHRIVVDNKYLYCWGGYNPEYWEVENSDDTNYPLFKELWRYQIYTGKWQLLKTHGEIPTQLASHTVTKIGNNLLHFGGTGVPFGMTNTNWLHLLDLNSLEWKVLFKPPETNPEREMVEDSNIPRAKYGHSMLVVGRYVYVVGGTCGYTYDTDVHRFDLQELVWEEVPAKSKYIPAPRYRHEIIYYKGKLLMLGGGAGVGYSAFSLAKIDVFDLNEQTWESVMTLPDEVSHTTQGQSCYPNGRRCHSCVKYQDNVYVYGGLAPEGIQRDLWRFHLPTYQWTEIRVPLPKPVYFHSAAVSQEGCMFILGGVTRIDDERTNALQIMWLGIPKLTILSWNVVVKCLDFKKCSSSPENLIHAGIPREYVELVL